MAEDIQTLAVRVREGMTQLLGGEWRCVSGKESALLTGPFFQVQLHHRGRTVASTITLRESGVQWRGPWLRFVDRPAVAAHSLARMCSDDVRRFHQQCPRVVAQLGKGWTGQSADVNLYRFSHPSHAPFAAHGYLDAGTVLFEGEHEYVGGRAQLPPGAEEPTLRAKLGDAPFVVAARLRARFIPALDRLHRHCGWRFERATAEQREGRTAPQNVIDLNARRP